MIRDMKILQLSILLFFLSFASVYSQTIELDPDSTDQFVIDPATFSEESNSNSMWELASFGKKDPTVYK